MTHRLLDLFSGIGAFSLGLERSGVFRAVAFCEQDQYCRKVLSRHWPEVPIYDDVRDLTAGRLAADGIAVDAICGGFPCTDISVAGRGAGIGGSQSGLWSHFARLVGELGPRYVFVENVAALLVRGLDRVLGDLATLGYDAEWHCIPAASIGAPHQRDRIWIVAYPDGGRRREQGDVGEASGDAGAGQSRDGGAVSVPLGPRLALGAGTLGEWSHAATTGSGWWATEPDVGRVVDGVADKVDRRKRLIALGNSLVPRIPEMLARALPCP